VHRCTVLCEATISRKPSVGLDRLFGISSLAMVCSAAFCAAWTDRPNVDHAAAPRTGERIFGMPLAGTLL